MSRTKFLDSCLFVSLVAFLSLALCGCGDISNAPAPTVLTAPQSILIGASVSWSVNAQAGDETSATAFDASNDVVFHSGYEEVSNFAWTPSRQGAYRLEVRIRHAGGVVELVSGTVDVTPRGTPSVSETGHPLVAMYTYAIPRGLEGRVRYTCETCPDEITTKTFATPRIVGTGAEVSVLLPALRPDRRYSVQHEIFKGDELLDTGPVSDHVTGPIPIQDQLLKIAVVVPPRNPKLNALLTVTPVFPFTGATQIPQMIDEAAETVWYLRRGGALTRPTGNGWAMLAEAIGGSATAIEIIDYTGQFLRRTTQKSVADQLEPFGFSTGLEFHHEVRPLPNNRYATFLYVEKLVTDLQGPGTVDVLGDALVVLDDRMRVVWAWNSFDHLDLARPAILGDTFRSGRFGIDLLLGETANDWTHSNSIEYDPNDGNLLVSVRNQSWVVKIAYEDGNGDGHVIWRLGKDGDFSTPSNDPLFWFRYQHDANILPDGRLILYDNGNDRIVADSDNKSRGQIYILNEDTMTVERSLNFDLESPCMALGSAALTPDGSMHFNSGAIGEIGPDTASMQEDIAPDGTSHGVFHTPAMVYRSFRMMDPFDTSPN